MLTLNWPMAGVQQGLCGMSHGMLTILSGEAKPCWLRTRQGRPAAIPLPYPASR